MSGHSKWSTIKHKKAANDAVKGNVFTKLANNIAIAVKKGGGVGDPEMNFSLRLAVDKARASSMPKENIQRAIERGMGKGDGAELQELTIEGFGPEGVAVMIEAVTDNHNRTVSELRNLMEKNGGRMGEPGSVAYQFERQGIVSFSGKLTEEMQLELIDQGMTDTETEEDGGVIYTEPEAVHKVVRYLQGKGFQEIDGVLGYRAKTTVTPANLGALESFLDLINDYDDVQEVYTNVA